METVIRVITGCFRLIGWILATEIDEGACEPSYKENCEFIGPDGEGFYENGDCAWLDDE